MCAKSLNQYKSLILILLHWFCLLDFPFPSVQNAACNCKPNDILFSEIWRGDGSQRTLYKANKIIIKYFNTTLNIKHSLTINPWPLLTTNSTITNYKLHGDRDSRVGLHDVCPPLSLSVNKLGLGRGIVMIARFSQE